MDLGGFASYSLRALPVELCGVLGDAEGVQIKTARCNLRGVGQGYGTR